MQIFSKITSLLGLPADFAQASQDFAKLGAGGMPGGLPGMPGMPGMPGAGDAAAPAGADGGAPAGEEPKQDAHGLE